jgi:hypothetical protein
MWVASVSRANARRSRQTEATKTGHCALPEVGVLHAVVVMGYLAYEGFRLARKSPSGT